MNPLPEQRSGEPDDDYQAFGLFCRLRGNLPATAAQLDIATTELRGTAKRHRWHARYRDWRTDSDGIADDYRRACLAWAADKDVRDRLERAATRTARRNRRAGGMLAAGAAGLVQELRGDLAWQADIARELGWPPDTIGTDAFTADIEHVLAEHRRRRAQQRHT